MSLEKMTIEAYSDPKFQSVKGQPYHVMINPEEYSHSYAIIYNDTNGQGANGTSQAFNRMGPETVSFTIWFDRSGVVRYREVLEDARNEPDYQKLQEALASVG